MENFKVIMFSVITLLVLLLVGYWAVATMEPGSTHVDKQKQKELEQTNEELTKEVEKLKSELRLLQPAEEPDQMVPKEETPKPVINPKYQTLINDLQKLVDDNVFMKEKSRGTRVGTLQTFLNIYNNTSKRVDNDYGKGTKTDIINFQKAVGLTADGEAGPSTFKKMIEWLKKQT